MTPINPSIRRSLDSRRIDSVKVSTIDLLTLPNRFVTVPES